jgi:hypothetical protein
MKKLWFKIGLAIGGVVTLLVLMKSASSMYEVAKAKAQKEFHGADCYAGHFGSVDHLEKAMQTRIEEITLSLEKAKTDEVMQRWAKRFGG